MGISEYAFSRIVRKMLMEESSYKLLRRYTLKTSKITVESVETLESYHQCMNQKCESGR